MLDRNGYAPSLMDDYDDYPCCYYCGRSNGKLDRHEIFFGSNRDNSKRHGMWVTLCRDCHTKAHQGDGELNHYLKRKGQEKYEQTHTREEFVRIFGRNYL